MNFEEIVFGFPDESAQRISVRTARLWSLHKPTRKVNSDRINANVFGFYAIKGISVSYCPERSKAEDMCAFLDAVRAANGSKRILMVIDNGPIPHSSMVLEHAEKLDIRFIFLPPYSPQFNPIELIWKTLKARISGMFLLYRDHLVATVEELFAIESAKESYATAWQNNFWPFLV